MKNAHRLGIAGLFLLAGAGAQAANCLGMRRRSAPGTCAIRGLAGEAVSSMSDIPPTHPGRASMVIILVGVAGSGKTTVGRTLAARLRCEFHDSDDLHPPQNREKMSRGIALSDEDRWPWLHAVRDLVQRCLVHNRCAVIACSALKQSYRDLLVVDPEKVNVVYLKDRKC